MSCRHAVPFGSASRGTLDGIAHYRFTEMSCIRVERGLFLRESGEVGRAAVHTTKHSWKVKQLPCALRKLEMASRQKRVAKVGETAMAMIRSPVAHSRRQSRLRRPTSLWAEAFISRVSHCSTEWVDSEPMAMSSCVVLDTYLC